MVEHCCDENCEEAIGGLKMVRGIENRRRGLGSRAVDIMGKDGQPIEPIEEGYPPLQSRSGGLLSSRADEDEDGIQDDSQKDQGDKEGKKIKDDKECKEYTADEGGEQYTRPADAPQIVATVSLPPSPKRLPSQHQTLNQPIICIPPHSTPFQTKFPFLSLSLSLSKQHPILTSPRPPTAAPKAPKLPSPNPAPSNNPSPSPPASTSKSSKSPPNSPSPNPSLTRNSARGRCLRARLAKWASRPIYDARGVILRVRMGLLVRARRVRGIGRRMRLRGLLRLLPRVRGVIGEEGEGERER